MRLALRFGRADWEQLLSELTHRQLLRWEAFFQIEPQGEEREDLRWAILYAMVNNRLRGSDEDPVKPAEMLFNFWGPRKRQRQSTADMKRALMKYTILKGGKVVEASGEVTQRTPNDGTTSESSVPPVAESPSG